MPAAGGNFWDYEAQNKISQLENIVFSSKFCSQFEIFSKFLKKNDGKETKLQTLQKKDECT